MSSEFEIIWYKGNDEHQSEIFKIREQVYSVEYDIEKKYIVDDDDLSDNMVNGQFKKTNNMGIKIDGKVVGTARLFYDNDKNDWVVQRVLQTHKFEGIGEILMKSLIQKAQHEYNAKRLIASSMLKAAKFYQKLGFICKTSIDDIYIVQKIPHVDMILNFQ